MYVYGTSYNMQHKMFVKEYSYSLHTTHQYVPHICINHQSPSTQSLHRRPSPTDSTSDSWFDRFNRQAGESSRVCTHRSVSSRRNGNNPEVVPKWSGPGWMIFIRWRKDRFLSPCRRTTPRHCSRSSFSSSDSTISCLLNLSLSLSFFLYLLCFPLTEVPREKGDSKAWERERGKKNREEEAGCKEKQRRERERRVALDTIARL